MTEESQRLARWLRLCGYDTAVSQTYPVSDLYRLAYNEQRIVVTRNHRITSGSFCRVVHLQSQQLDAQLRQLIEQLGLTVDDAQAFTRCNRCNVELEDIERAAVKGKVPPYVWKTQQVFHRCPRCQRIYWAATHWQRACGFFERVRLPAPEPGAGSGGQTRGEGGHA